jgi:hypothetical protein
MKKDKKLVMIGVKHGSDDWMYKTFMNAEKEPEIEVKTENQFMQPGTYNKFTFAAAYPEQYQQMVRAGAPAIGDGVQMTIQVMK